MDVIILMIIYKGPNTKDYIIENRWIWQIADYRFRAQN